MSEVRVLDHDWSASRGTCRKCGLGYDEGVYRAPCAGQADMLPALYRVAHLAAARFPRGYVLSEQRVAVYRERDWQKPKPGEVQEVLGFADLWFSGVGMDGAVLVRRRWGRPTIVAKVEWLRDNSLLWTTTSWLAPMINVDERGQVQGWIGLLVTSNPRLEE